MIAAATDRVRSDFSSPTGDRHIGTAGDLVAARIIEARQIPGLPGMPTASASFVEGVLQSARAKNAHDERWMQVMVYGKKLQVLKGISAAESQRRRAADEEAKEKLDVSAKPDIGLPAAATQFSEACAAFQLGDSVTINGKIATVTGGYRLRSTWARNGEYVQPGGERVDYRHGYNCIFPNGDEFFWPASAVRDRNGKRAHLRLVRSRAPAAKAAPPPHINAANSWPFPIVGISRADDLAAGAAS